MKSTVTFVSSLAVVGITKAGVITPRQTSFRFECDGQLNPDRGDCDALFKTFTDGTKTYTPPPGGNVWSINLGDASNCQVDIVWGEKDSTYVVTENQIDQGVFGVESTCFTSEDASTGGYAVDVGGRFQIGVRNNPTYDPPKAKRVQSNLIPMGSKNIGKRADGDTSFEYGVHTVNAKPSEFKHNIGEGLAGGSVYEWSKSDSVTDHISFSSEVSGGIEGMLSASLSTEISHDYTTTSGETTTITIDCDSNQYGQIYFQAYAEIWEGSLQPSGQHLKIQKPMSTDDGDNTSGFYSYDCIAK